MGFVVVMLCLLGVPVAAMVRAVFRRFGVVGFGVAWVTFVGVFGLNVWLMPDELRIGGLIAFVLSFVVVWGLGRARVLVGD
jgi:hypothetical protein